MTLHEAMKAGVAMHESGLLKIDTRPDNPEIHYLEGRPDIENGSDDVRWRPVEVQHVFRQWPLDGWKPLDEGDE